jgi:spore germination protein GerM
MRISFNGKNATIVLSVGVLLLSACTGRTILHGTRATSSHHPQHNNKIVVWFVKPANNGDPRLVSVARVVNSSDRLQAAVQELLEGPSAHEEHDGLGSEIPRGTILLDLKRSGKNVELNLSRRFASGGGTSSFETRLEQLRRTVATAAETPVYLNIEGKRLNIAEGEGIEIPQPINR